MMNKLLLSAVLVATVVVVGGIALHRRSQELQRSEQAQFEILVEHELDKTVSLAQIAGTERKLTMVLRHLAAQTQIPMVLDRAALTKTTKLDSGTIDVPAATLTLRSALGMLGHQAGIDYYTLDGQLVITDEQKSAGRLTTRVYPLPQLGGPEQRFGSDPETWLQVVRVVIEPDSWEDVGGQGKIIPLPGALVVHQKRSVHERLRQFFRQLAEASAIPDAQNDHLSSFTARERRIHEALNRPCNLSCSQMPLVEALDWVSRKYRLPIVLCRQKLEGAAVDHATLVSLDLHGTSLRSVLRSLLRQVDLTCVLRDEVLEVTTPEDASDQQRVVAYNVRDLVRVNGSDGQDYDSVIDLITSTVSPDSWEGSGPGNVMTLSDGWIVFAQTDEVHEETVTLLQQLRGAASSAEDVALERTVQVDYEQMPLQEIAADLAQQAGINVRFDHRCLEEAAVNLQTPVSCHLPPLPLRSSLSLLLGSIDSSVGLDYFLADECLVITTQLAANAERELLVLDVRGLAGNDEAETMFTQENLVDLITKFVEPSGWNNVGGPASIETWQSLLVISARRSITSRVRQLVEALTKFRDQSLEAKQRKVAVHSNLPLEIGSPQDPGLLMRIYPVDDLLEGEGASNMDDLAAARAFVLEDTWRDAGRRGEIAVVPPGGLLVAQSREGHLLLSRFLDELRLHVLENQPVPEWLIARQQGQEALDQALAAQDQVLKSPLLPLELAAELAELLNRKVALGIELADPFLDPARIGPIAPLRDEAPPRTLREQLTAVGLTLIQTEEGLELTHAPCERTLAFYPAQDLLKPKGRFDADELAAILDDGIGAHAGDWLERRQRALLICIHGWLVIRGHGDYHEQVREMLDYVRKEQEHLPRAEEVYQRGDPKEAGRLSQQLLQAGSRAEQLYLAFVLRNAEVPADGYEELALRCESLSSPKDWLLARRLKELLHRWLKSEVAQKRLESLFEGSQSRLLQRSVIRIFASRKGGSVSDSENALLSLYGLQEPPEFADDLRWEMRLAIARPQQPLTKTTPFDERLHESPQDRSLRKALQAPPPWRRRPVH